MAKETITLEQARKRIDFFNEVEAYKPITLVKKIVGFSLIGYGAVTIIFPAGSVWAIMGGCALLGIDYKKFLKTLKFYGKKLIDWAYGNRTWKLMKRNLKARFM